MFRVVRFHFPGLLDTGLRVKLVSAFPLSYIYTPSLICEPYAGVHIVMVLETGLSRRGLSYEAHLVIWSDYNTGERTVGYVQYSEV